MLIIGCDYHPAFQQIALVDTDTGELQERRLQHREEAERFYRDLAAERMKVRVGMEASGHARWFERLLSELQFELWIGDAAEIRTKRVRKQKTDRQDAQLILKLMLEDRFPEIWVPSWENRDLRQLLWHRQRSTGVARSTDSDDCRADPSHRAGSGEVSGSAAIADASRGRPTDCLGIRADYRESGSVSMWQADRQLSGAGTVGEIEWGSAPAGTYHETREHTAAFPAGGGSASDGAEPPGMAE